MVRWSTVLISIAFIGLWHTGFIGAKLGLPHAPALTFLLVRFAAAAALLAGVAVLVGAPWPKGRALLHTSVAGLLVHGVYLGGVFVAIGMGLPAGVTALIVSLQPLLTGALAGGLLGETVTRRQWLGLALGLVGVAFVLWEKLVPVLDQPGQLVGWLGALGCAGAALAGITLGTLYQKRFGGSMDLRSGSAVQYAVCAAAYLPVAALTEDMRIDWTGDFIIAFLWLTLVLSVAAISLFYILIRRGDAARVASLMYLVPPLTATTAYFLFGETLGVTALIGMGIVALAVGLVTGSPQHSKGPAQQREGTSVR